MIETIKPTQPTRVLIFVGKMAAHFDFHIRSSCWNELNEHAWEIRCFAMDLNCFTGSLSPIHKPLHID
jgi:hypothetical protein